MSSLDSESLSGPVEGPQRRGLFKGGGHQLPAAGLSKARRANAGRQIQNYKTLLPETKLFEAEVSHPDPHAAFAPVRPV